MLILVLGMICFDGLSAQNDSLAVKKQEVVLNGITCGPLPYLKYGPGIDRLGGAKMTYLDTAIVLQVVDSLNDDYIVRLSQNHQAFKPLSEAIINRMSELGLAEFGTIGSFNFSLNGPTEYPNCLVEVAFLSNEEDETRITDPDFQRSVAKKIRAGVIDWIRAAK